MYPAYDGMPKMKAQTKQTEMGKVSNLITDMTIKGAPYDEIARAVRHSMVVIDAEKHHLNYKQSEKDNGIQQLKDKYQAKEGKEHGGGAATLISRAKSTEYVDARKMTYKIDPVTGEKIWRETGESYEKNGKIIKRKSESTKMAETKDAHTLSSGTPMEDIYADYANQMKSLANKARLSYEHTPNLEYSPSARKTYAKEVESLNTKLAIAQKNAPRERQALIIANANYEAKLAANPQYKNNNEKNKKNRGQSLTDARIQVGAGKERINITDKEWEAIQAGAITNNKLVQILNNTDSDKLKERAMPNNTRTVSDSKVARMKAMAASGYSLREIAEAVGVSPSTVANHI
jgi:hypothetical protein